MPRAVASPSNLVEANVTAARRVEPVRAPAPVCQGSGPDRCETGPVPFFVFTLAGAAPPPPVNERGFRTNTGKAQEEIRHTDGTSKSLASKKAQRDANRCVVASLTHPTCSTEN